MKASWWKALSELRGWTTHVQFDKCDILIIVVEQRTIVPLSCWVVGLLGCWVVWLFGCWCYLFSVEHNVGIQVHIRIHWTKSNLVHVSFAYIRGYAWSRQTLRRSLIPRYYSVRVSYFSYFSHVFGLRGQDGWSCFLALTSAHFSVNSNYSSTSKFTPTSLSIFHVFAQNTIFSILFPNTRNICPNF